MSAGPYDADPGDRYPSRPGGHDGPGGGAPANTAHDATVRAGFDAALSVVQAVEASGVSTLDWFEHAAIHCRHSGVSRDAVRGAVELGIADGLGEGGGGDASLAMLRELLDTTVDRIYRG